MTKKKNGNAKKAVAEGIAEVKAGEQMVTRSNPKYKLVSMVKDDDIIPNIEKTEAEGFELNTILPTGSYFSLLFKRV